MKSRVLTIPVLFFLLSACAPEPLTYEGIPLATASLAAPLELPSAWLIQAHEAVPGRIAAGGIGLAHFDPQPSMPDLVSVEVPTDQAAIMLFHSPSFDNLEATVRPWPSDGTILPLIDETARSLDYTATTEGKFYVVTLEPIGDQSDLLLTLSVTMDDTWAFYLCRINSTE